MRLAQNDPACYAPSSNLRRSHRIAVSTSAVRTFFVQVDSGETATKPLAARENILLRRPRIVCPDMPDMAFRIEAREASAAVRFVFDILHNC